MTAAIDDLDITDTLKAKSDQLNAADLVGGPITVQITGGRRNRDDKQPLSLQISGGHMPWKPCKTMRRLMATATGTPKARQWFGVWVTLYRDPTVTYGKEDVGGIRVGALSCIDKPMDVTLMTRRGQYTHYTIEPLRNPSNQGAPTANLDELLTDNGLTRGDVDRWLADNGKPSLTESPEKEPGLAGWLAADSSRLDAIRALIPVEGGE